MSKRSLLFCCIFNYSYIIIFCIVKRTTSSQRENELFVTNKLPTEFLGLNVRNLRIPVEYATRHNASVGIPLVDFVASAVRVEPSAEKASMLVSNQHLAAHHVSDIFLPAACHLALAKLVERSNHVHVVIQVDSAEIHQQYNAPIIAP